MKTSVKTLIASTLTAIVLSTSAFTSEAANRVNHDIAVSSKIDFNKVVITGNVMVQLVQSDRQRVIICEEYNKAKTSVMQKGDKLYINSNEEEPITMNVYVKDLQRIDASQTSSVTTRGKFASNVLQVFLKDSAQAYVNAETESLYTVIKGNSTLKLKGSSNDHTLVKSGVSTLKMDQFASIKTTTESPEGLVLSTNFENRILKDSLIADYKVK